ncbi:6-hydroxymethylpterin diphosphokinase MptE-like protein [Leptospira ellisii]|uniref:6-hydroxymethylpterin diphosphokinase MptE-like protein n=1 Tax=Leptospira ellisii TaxID=2023197 RepID=A0AAE4TXV7_9LEPT|nr:6-hydroxymethylpterin diphosphokinase MptE-like protein [Leptospira ellisii]MDV6234877.1 6-hydroxymethylpterin diphosphokinase MptE-like protein [Leptospira ellisii]
MIFGLGLGYHVESYLQKATSPIRLLLIEPIPDLKPLLNPIFERILATHTNQGHDIRLVFGLDRFLSRPLSDWIREDSSRVLPFLHPVYTRKFSDLSLRFLDSLKPSSSQNRSAKTYFQKTWSRNVFRNLERLSESPNGDFSGIIVGAEPGYFSDQTLLFTGAAPSLEEKTPWILRNRNRFHLLASDTSLGWLLSFGIVPDCVLSIDSSRGTLFHFRKLLPETVPILTWLGGAAFLFDLPNPKWIYFSTHPLDQTAASLFFPQAPILENPSLNLAGIALSFAKRFSYGRTIFQGVDFRRIGGKTHCRASGYETFDRVFLSRKTSLFQTRFQKTERWEKRNSILEILKRESPERFDREVVSDLKEIETKEMKSGIRFESPRSIRKKEWIRFCAAHPEFDLKEYITSRIRTFVR